MFLAFIYRVKLNDAHIFNCNGNFINISCNER